jgi:hypothetical protein
MTGLEKDDLGLASYFLQEFSSRGMSSQIIEFLRGIRRQHAEKISKNAEK